MAVFVAWDLLSESWFTALCPPLMWRGWFCQFPAFLLAVIMYMKKICIKTAGSFHVAASRLSIFRIFSSPFREKYSKYILETSTVFLTVQLRNASCVIATQFKVFLVWIVACMNCKCLKVSYLRSCKPGSEYSEFSFCSFWNFSWSWMKWFHLYAPPASRQ